MKNIEKSLEYFYQNILNYIPPVNHPIIEQFYRDAKAIHFSELQELYMEGFEDCAESSANEIEKKNKTMHIYLPRPQPMLTKEEEEKQYWDILKYDSHKWVEFAVGYYQCEYCKGYHTSMMSMDGKSICVDNPHLKKN